MWLTRVMQAASAVNFVIFLGIEMLSVQRSMIVFAVNEPPVLALELALYVAGVVGAALMTMVSAIAYQMCVKRARRESGRTAS